MSEQTDVERVLVKTHPDEGERVGLAERDPLHPVTDDFPQGGEIYVAGQGQEPQLVARTAGVLDALAKKRLIEVAGPPARRSESFGAGSARTTGSAAHAAAPEPDRPAGPGPAPATPRRGA